MDRRVSTGRRTLLVRAGACGALALAGCLGAGTPDGTTGTPTDTPTSTPAPVSLENASLRVTGAGCGQEVDAADVEFRPEGRIVRVTGTIPGSDACRTAVLAGTDYDADADRFRVVVATERREPTDGTTGCAQCIVELDYEVTCEFADPGGLPGAVEVVHGTGEDRRVVTTARDDG